MRFHLTAAVVAVGACLIVAGVMAAERTPRANAVVTYSLLRSGSPVRTFTSEQLCLDARDAPETGLIAVDARTRTSGEARYVCRKDNAITARFVANQVPPPAPVDCVVSEWGAWSDPAWLACADGMQSRSIVRTRTIVTQPANGGAACPSLVETQAQTRVCPGAAILTWTLPTRNTDGTTLTNLAGIRVHFGSSPNEPSNSVQLSGPITRHVLYGLPAGTQYFAVRAYTSAGTESAMSNVEPKVVQ